MMFVRHGPLWFRLSTVLLIAWELAGCFSCLQQIRLGADAMGSATAYDRALFAQLPGWYTPLFALSVGTGLIGAVLLFLRKAIARPFLVASLVAIVLQFGWLFVRTDIIAVKGAVEVLAFPLVIVVLALYAIWLSGHAVRKGWVR
jgi:hypothetical protein